MLVREDELGPKIVMLDCGLVTVASPTDWSHLKELLRAIASGKTFASLSHYKETVKRVLNK